LPVGVGSEADRGVHGDVRLHAGEALGVEGEDSLEAEDEVGEEEADEAEGEDAEGVGLPGHVFVLVDVEAAEEPGFGSGEAFA